MCWGWRKRQSSVFDTHLHHGKTHFFFDKFVYFIHGVRPTTYSNNEDRLLDLRSKYSLTYCMLSITFGFLLGIIGFIADDWVTMAAFHGNERDHIPYNTEEPDVRLRKGLIMAIDYFMVKDTMYGRLVDELGLLERPERCYDWFVLEKAILKKVQMYWRLSRASAFLTLFCSTWVTAIMLSTVLTSHWPVWQHRRGGRKLTKTIKMPKAEESTESVTASTALNIGQSTFLTCYCFAMTSCNYNALMSVLSEYEKRLNKMIVCVEYPGYNYYFACASFMLMTFAFMNVIDAYDAA